MHSYLEKQLENKKEEPIDKQEVASLRESLVHEAKSILNNDNYAKVSLLSEFFLVGENIESPVLLIPGGVEKLPGEVGQRITDPIEIDTEQGKLKAFFCQTLRRGGRLWVYNGELSRAVLYVARLNDSGAGPEMSEYQELLSFSEVGIQNSLNIPVKPEDLKSIENDMRRIKEAYEAQSRKTDQQ